VPWANGLLGPSSRSSPVIKLENTSTPQVRTMGPGCRKSGSANGSPSGILRSVAIGTDGWSVMTVGITNTSKSVSNPDVHDGSFSFDLIALDIFPPIPDISIDDISLRDSRSAILLEIRLTCDTPSFTARHVCR